MRDGVATSLNSALSGRESSSSLPRFFLHGWCLGTLCLWALAFYGTPEATPEWLLQAKIACFGRTETGLPDAGGWMLLALAPITLLVTFLIAFGSDLRAALRAPPLFSKGLFLLWLVCATVISAWVVERLEAAQLVQSVNFQPTDIGQLADGYPFSTETAPNFLLIDQAGREVTLATFRGKPFLLGFIFAHCKTVCPVLVHNLRTAHAELGPETIPLVFITLDPRRDTPRSLPSVAKRYELSQNQYILSGDVSQVEAVANAYGVGAERDEKTGDVSHPPLVFVIGAKGERGYALLNPPADWITEAAHRALKRVAP